MCACSRPGSAQHQRDPLPPGSLAWERLARGFRRLGHGQPYGTQPLAPGPCGFSGVVGDDGDGPANVCAARVRSMIPSSMIGRRMWPGGSNMIPLHLPGFGLVVPGLGFGPG